jgi:hypothetical protein
MFVETARRGWRFRSSRHPVSYVDVPRIMSWVDVHEQWRDRWIETRTARFSLKVAVSLLLAALEAGWCFCRGRVIDGWRYRTEAAPRTR